MTDAFPRFPHVDIDRRPRDADSPWNIFSSRDYWRRNYGELQLEDRKIIRQVSQFFIRAFADRPAGRAPAAPRGLDVGSGTNLYPALLMLPWTEQILLTDFSASNVRWLSGQLADDSGPWTWEPFWHELRETKGYNQIGEPRRRLLEACVSEPGFAGIEQRSVFDLPEARWDVGTMFFVAESITAQPVKFREAVARFVGALKPGAPFAAAFMAGSGGYPVADSHFPALSITRDDVRQNLTELGATQLSAEMLKTDQRVRDGYEGMIVATGFSRGR